MWIPSLKEETGWGGAGEGHQKTRIHYMEETRFKKSSLKKKMLKTKELVQTQRTERDTVSINQGGI